MTFNSGINWDTIVGPVKTKIMSEITIRYDDTTERLNGVGDNRYTERSHYPVPAPCSITDGGGAPGNSEVMELSLGSLLRKKQPKHIQMYFWPGKPSETWTLICPMLSEPESPYWFTGFGHYHEPELSSYRKPHQPPQIAFAFRSWVFGSGATFDTTGSFPLKDATVTAETHFKLKHTPE